MPLNPTFFERSQGSLDTSDDVGSCTAIALKVEFYIYMLYKTTCITKKRFVSGGIDKQCLRLEESIVLLVFRSKDRVKIQAIRKAFLCICFLGIRSNEMHGQSS